MPSEGLKPNLGTEKDHIEGSGSAIRLLGLHHHFDMSFDRSKGAPPRRRNTGHGGNVLVIHSHQLKQ